MEEIWKDIIGYEGCYQASNLGRIKSLKRECYCGNGRTRTVKERILKQRKRKDGYIDVSMYKDGLNFKLLVHCLVGSAFLGYKIKRNGLVIDHINCNKCDNNLDNLRIITHRMNVSKGFCERSPSRLIGATWNKGINKWSSRIVIKGKQIYLGVFDTELEAHKAYVNKLKQINNV